MIALKTLKKPRDFDRVFRQGRSVAAQHLVLYCLKRPRPGGRVAFCVSKKLGSAVVRNHVRRRLREVYRLNQEKLATRWDVILLARPLALSASFQDLEKEFLNLAERANLIREVAAPACSVGERYS
ncbi:MAG: ribonuclease P protein component [Candidatus Xenobium sp.]